MFQQCHSPVKPVYDILYGCMDETSMNYNQNATLEDSSCVNYFKVIELYPLYKSIVFEKIEI